MSGIGLVFGGYLFLMALPRPLTILGLVLVPAAAIVTPSRLTGTGARATWVAAAGALAASAWALGPTTGVTPSLDLTVWAIAGVIGAFLATVVIQVILALLAREWGFPVLVVAIVAMSLLRGTTGDSAQSIGVNLVVLPALALVLVVGRRVRRRLIDSGEIIRWCILSLVGLDLVAATSLATGALQAGLLGLTLCTVGLAPLILNKPEPRIRAAGLICAIFTALLGMLAASAALPTPSPGLVDLLDSLVLAFFWVIAFPASAVLAATSARPASEGASVLR